MLEVITRHLVSERRAALLARQQASLAPYTGLWCQTVLADPIGRGIGFSHERLRTVEPCGAYVWVLDDDDEAVNACELHVWLQDQPTSDLHIFQFTHAVAGAQWPPFRQPLGRGHVGPQCLIASKALWMQTRTAWRAVYDGDYEWCEAAYEGARGRVAWHEQVIARIDQVNEGRP